VVSFLSFSNKNCVCISLLSHICVIYNLYTFNYTEVLIGVLGALVISSYAPCPNIKQVVTPDLKGPSRGLAGIILLVYLSGGKNRLGGTALAQCFKQLGDDVPDLDQPQLLKQAFIATQKLIRGEFTQES
jgi:phosphoribosylformylglycinamidine (FGAM) synthase-like enzyme